MKQLIALIPETDEETWNHDPGHAFVNMDGKLTEDGELLVNLTFSVLQRACYQNAKAHGWYDGAEERNFGEVCMLFTSEISEAFEAYRDGDDPAKISYSYKNPDGSRYVDFAPGMHWDDGVLGKPEGIAAELADVFIRIFDTAQAMGIPLAQALIRKHAYNFSRPYRHGGKKA